MNVRLTLSFFLLLLASVNTLAMFVFVKRMGVVVVFALKVFKTPIGQSQSVVFVPKIPSGPSSFASSPPPHPPAVQVFVWSPGRKKWNPPRRPQSCPLLLCLTGSPKTLFVLPPTMGDFRRFGGLSGTLPLPPQCADQLSSPALES